MTIIKTTETTEEQWALLRVLRGGRTHTYDGSIEKLDPRDIGDLADWHRVLEQNPEIVPESMRRDGPQMEAIIDSYRADVERLTKALEASESRASHAVSERDEARRESATIASERNEYEHERDAARADVERLTKERDEAELSEAVREWRNCVDQWLNEAGYTSEWNGPTRSRAARLLRAIASAPAPVVRAVLVAETADDAEVLRAARKHECLADMWEDNRLPGAVLRARVVSADHYDAMKAVCKAAEAVHSVECDYDCVSDAWLAKALNRLGDVVERLSREVKP